MSERVYATPAGIELGSLDLLAPGSAGNFVIQLRAGRFHGFVVRREDGIYGYVDRCPHMGLPLAKTLDDYPAHPEGSIVCGWHGAMFEVETGRCIGGPCHGARLQRWPVSVANDVIVTSEPV